MRVRQALRSGQGEASKWFCTNSEAGRLSCSTRDTELRSGQRKASELAHASGGAGRLHRGVFVRKVLGTKPTSVPGSWDHTTALHTPPNGPWSRRPQRFRLLYRVTLRKAQLRLELTVENKGEARRGP
ncbi:hypothetical protein HPB49_004414 [Dermacentor silvarum]|uniref:Uncharacterized protein n=1 Tax=Dermacentor silvarum TaxID=543639 RepID=A0ACB8DIG3_DERSI|nr:hypothetical protein HPB49_004414 [Dermacentor silvarum]